jgi:hypothetical protein
MVNLTVALAVLAASIDTPICTILKPWLWGEFVIVDGLLPRVVSDPILPVTTPSGDIAVKAAEMQGEERMT